MFEFLNPFSTKTKPKPEQTPIQPQYTSTQTATPPENPDDYDEFDSPYPPKQPPNTLPNVTESPRASDLPQNPQPSAPAKRMPKFRRALDKLPNRNTTTIDFEIIKTIYDFNFLSSTQLLKLINADRQTIYKHLQTLYHQQLINRVHFPTAFVAGEFYYYLDNTQALDLLITETDHQKQDFNYEEIRRNKQKAYGDMHLDESQNTGNAGKQLFLRHETMISRFHVALELATRATDGQVKIKTWKEGAELYNYAIAPKYNLTKHKDQNNQTQTNYQEHETETEKIPHRPDAFFTLIFPKEPDKADNSFFYEADRKTTSTPKLNKKLRGHYHAVVRQKLHQQAPYTVPSIRAVLIETTSYQWAEHIHQEAHSKTVSPNQSKLFWFTCLDQLTKPEKTFKGKAQSKKYPYLENPKNFFSRFWVAIGQDELYSLLD